MCNQSVQLSNGHFSGTLHNNESNRKRQGSGFNPLSHICCPEQNIFHDDAVGLNFEHIMNGTAEDADICMFTPCSDPCSIFSHTDSSACIVHNARDSSWNMDSKMSYTFSGEHSIDLVFRVTSMQRTSTTPLISNARRQGGTTITIMLRRKGTRYTY